MSTQGGLPPMGEPEEAPHVTRAIAAEAALWVARLHGPSRTREMELQCLQWQAQSAAHRHAFERCTDTWMEVPNAARLGGFSSGLGGESPGEGSSGGGAPGPRRLLLQLAVVAAVAAAGTGWLLTGEADDYRTEVGEAKSVMLADGTRMSLNTDTRVEVDLGPKRRLVQVAGGEVAFEVAKDAARPFVVRVGGSEVEALGTVFAVRLLPSEPLAVTLVEGRVAVRASARAGADAVAPPQPLVMKPGDRVVLTRALGPGAAVAPRLDRPRLDQVLAWQRNEAVFDGASLADAVAEMNRYSRTPVVLVGALARADGTGWLVSGQFRTGDNAGFARALATLHGLTLQQKAGRLELSQGTAPTR